MIVTLLMSAAAVAGPGIRHDPSGKGWPSLIQTYNRRGETVRQLQCEYRYHLTGTDPLPGLAANRAFMAILLAKDGAIDGWDLEAAWPTCKFLPVPPS